MSAVIQRAPDGRLLVSGELDFTTVTRLNGDALKLLQTADTLRVDLQGIARSDSAGLALLIEWMRIARRQGKPIQFLNIPAQMLAIARVSGLDEVLPLGRG